MWYRSSEWKYYIEQEYADVVNARKVAQEHQDTRLLQQRLLSDTCMSYWLGHVRRRLDDHVGN